METILAQHFLHNFTLPKTLRDDIVYCQRALAVHIDIRKMAILVHNDQKHKNPAQLKYVLDELESEITSINTDQQLLCIYLNQLVNEYMANNKEIQPKKDFIMKWLTCGLSKDMRNENLHVFPTNVSVRCTMETLLNTYFEPKIEEDSENNCCEMINAETSENVNKHIKQMNFLQSLQNSNLKVGQNEILCINSKSLQLLQLGATENPVEFTATITPSKENSKGQIKNITSPTQSNENVGYNENSSINSESQHVLLVEVIENPVNSTAKTSRSNTQSLQNRSANAERNKTSCNNSTPQQVTETPVESTGKITRSKRKQKISILGGYKVPIVKNAHAEPMIGENLPTQMSNKTTSPVISPKATPKKNQRKRGRPQPATLALPILPKEIAETANYPQDYDQNKFLSLLELYSMEKCLQMQQRRSKRLRRSVQSNSDYDYF